MKELIILTDYDGNFLISIADLKNYTSMDVGKIEKYFTARGFDVKIKRFSELDLTESYNGKYVLYQTSEAKGSFYKRYIEDIIYFLEKQGAVVLPKFEYLKAHHNKVYMEIMRTRFANKPLKTINSRCFGSEKEALKSPQVFPVVIKQASGSGSYGVFLARNYDEYRKYIKSAGRVLISQSDIYLMLEKLKNIAKYFLAMFDKEYIKRIEKPIYKPIVVQTFIEGLSGDYKVLFFGGKYYTLYRKNRDNDFRASGSGKLYELRDHEYQGLLDFARNLTQEIDFPIIGMDIGFDGKAYHLIEFQMIHIGPYALQMSKLWHEYRNGQWVRFEGKSDLEEEFSRSIYQYI